MLQVSNKHISSKPARGVSRPWGPRHRKTMLALPRNPTSLSYDRVGQRSFLKIISKARFLPMGTTLQQTSQSQQQAGAKLQGRHGQDPRRCQICRMGLLRVSPEKGPRFSMPSCSHPGPSTGLQTMPAQPWGQFWDSLSSHVKPQRLLGAPLAPNSPSSHSAFGAPLTAHPKHNPLDPPPHVFTQTPKGPDPRDTQA